MSLSTMAENDEALAANVRTKARDLNFAIGAAENAGLKVELETEVYQMRRPDHSVARDRTSVSATVLRPV